MIVADTSPLIGLGVLGRLDLLPSLFRDVLVPPEVVGEALRGQRSGAWEIQRALDEGTLQVREAAEPGRFRAQLDPGESSALALAVELAAELLLIDERRGRRVAQAEGIAVIGTLGVLHLASALGLLEELEAPLAALRDHGFRLPR